VLGTSSVTEPPPVDFSLIGINNLQRILFYLVSFYSYE